MRFEIMIGDEVKCSALTIDHAKHIAGNCYGITLISWQEPVKNNGIWYGIGTDGMVAATIVAIVD